jgi:hypothetical protein
MERNLIIVVTDPEGLVVDMGHVTVADATGDARDAATALAQAGEAAPVAGMPEDW